MPLLFGMAVSASPMSTSETSCAGSFALSFVRGDHECDVVARVDALDDRACEPVAAGEDGTAERLIRLQSEWVDGFGAVRRFIKPLIERSSVVAHQRR